MGTNKQDKFSEMDDHVRKQWEVELIGQAGNKLWRALNVMLRNASSFVGKGEHLEVLNKEIGNVRTEKDLKISVGLALYINA